MFRDVLCIQRASVWVHKMSAILGFVFISALNADFSLKNQRFTSVILLIWIILDKKLHAGFCSQNRQNEHSRSILFFTCIQEVDSIKQIEAGFILEYWNINWVYLW